MGVITGIPNADPLAAVDTSRKASPAADRLSAIARTSFEHQPDSAVSGLYTVPVTPPGETVPGQFDFPFVKSPWTLQPDSNNPGSPTSKLANVLAKLNIDPQSAQAVSVLARMLERLDPPGLEKLAARMEALLQAQQNGQAGSPAEPGIRPSISFRFLVTPNGQEKGGELFAFEINSVQVTTAEALRSVARGDSLSNAWQILCSSYTHEDGRQTTVFNYLFGQKEFREEDQQQGFVSDSSRAQRCRIHQASGACPNEQNGPCMLEPLCIAAELGFKVDDNVTRDRAIYHSGLDAVEE